MTLTIEKPKIWKSFSYPLKSPLLKEAIDNSGLDCHVDLVYWTPQQNKEDIYSLITCEYWLANRHVDHNRFYIRAGVVKSEHRKLAEQLITSEVLPKLIEYMCNNHLQTANSTSLEKKSYFEGVFKNNKVMINS